jgi:hypothetical protein
VDFSEARDLFVNIFRILDRTGKIVDLGLILENPRGLSAKSAKSGPRVDFQKSRDLFAIFLKYPRITNCFLTDNSWTGSTSPWTDASADNGHGSVLTGAHPPAAPMRQSSPAGAQNGEGGTGSSSRASLGLERRRGGRATTGKAQWCRRLVRVRLELGQREMRARKGAVKLGEVARLL